MPGLSSAIGRQGSGLEHPLVRADGQGMSVRLMPTCFGSMFGPGFGGGPEVRRIEVILPGKPG